MPHINKNSYKRDRAKELMTLAEILNRVAVCQDTSPLYRAASQVNSSHGSTWGYEMDRLRFRLDARHHAVPQQVMDLTLELSLRIEANYVPEDEGEFLDPFQKLDFNIVTSGISVSDRDQRVMCAWHLDRDIGQAGDPEQTFIHPQYHFQFGGRDMQYVEHGFCSVLLLETPRIAHPPMDAILGVDFVLTNYFRSDRLKFREEGTYINILRTAQDRIWRPYALALASRWTESRQSLQWPPTKLWPQLSV